MYPPLFSLNNLVDVPYTRTDPLEGVETRIIMD